MQWTWCKPMPLHRFRSVCLFIYLFLISLLFVGSLRALSIWFVSCVYYVLLSCFALCVFFSSSFSSFVCVVYWETWWLFVRWFAERNIEISCNRQRQRTTMQMIATTNYSCVYFDYLQMEYNAMFSIQCVKEFLNDDHHRYLAMALTKQQNSFTFSIFASTSLNERE